MLRFSTKANRTYNCNCYNSKNPISVLGFCIFLTVISRVDTADSADPPQKCFDLLEYVTLALAITKFLHKRFQFDED